MEATTRKDIISHFILRLAYCQTDDLRRWFIQYECELFRQKFQSIPDENKVNFLKECHLPYERLRKENFTDVREKLLAVLQSQRDPDASTLQEGKFKLFFEVPFEKVPELVASRKVYLENGNAFLKADQLTALLVGHFRSQLSKCLILTARKWGEFSAGEQQRIAPLVESLHKRYLGPDYGDPAKKSGANNQTSISELPTLAEESFPLCMRHLYNRLRADHHLRYGGRMQLGLFLKAVGLSLQDALAFWKAEFAPRVPGDVFEKQYAYTIRHNYGKEGNRRDYTPHSCMKIITSTPGNGEHHGCPYRHQSEDTLRSMLQALTLDSQKIDGIMDKVRNKHFQLACQETFEGVHECACETGINHPNQYFDESRRLREEVDQKVLPGTPIVSSNTLRTVHTPPTAIAASKLGN